MNSLLLSFGLIAPALSSAPAPAAVPSVNPPSLAAVPGDDASMFGEPLIINGKRIADRDIKLFLIYGPCSRMIDLAKLNLIAEDQIGRSAIEAAEQSVKKPATAAAEAEVKQKEAPAREAAEAAIKKREASQPFGTPEERQQALDAETKTQLAKVWASPDDRQKVYDAAYKREYDKLFPNPDAQKKAFEAELVKQKSLMHEKFAVTDDDVQKEVDSAIADFKNKYPVLDVTAEISRAYRNVDWYRQDARTMLLFDRVFLPPNPDEWPVVTQEAVRADSGDILVDDARQSYEARKKQVEKTGGPFPKEDIIYLNIMREIVREAVYGLVDFKMASDGIAPDLVLWADMNGDGKPELTITIDEMWKKVSDTITQNDIDSAKQWFVTSTATADRLKAEGHLLSPEDCKKSLSVALKQFGNSNSYLEQMATKTLMFPSLEAYKTYYCLMEGFKQATEAQLKPGPANDLPQVLREHYDRANRVMGLGQVEVEIMLVSAFDIPHFAWKKDGWANAEKKANDLKAKIEANTKEYNEQLAKRNEAKAKGQEYKPEKEAVEPYRFWTQMMDDNSEYWDPPAPEGAGQKGSDVGYKRKGRFGPRYRNDLINFVGETYYSQWVTGVSITDYSFFDQTEGSVAGPFKGPLGYYLTRVIRRSPPTRPLNLSEPKHVDLLRDDYYRAAFIQYAKDAVSKATVKGFTP